MDKQVAKKVAKAPAAILAAAPPAVPGVLAPPAGPDVLALPAAPGVLALPAPPVDTEDIDVDSMARVLQKANMDCNCFFCFRDVTSADLQVSCSTCSRVYHTKCFPENVCGTTVNCSNDKCEGGSFEVPNWQTDMERDM